MKLDRLLHVLLPKHDQFYVFFEKDVENLLTAATLFSELMVDTMSPEERALKIRRIEELEHKGDEITHQIFSEVASNFITPIDREDVHALASALDEVLDYLKGAASRIVLYRVTHIPPEATKLASLILEQVKELHKAIGFLRDLRNVEAIRECLVRINSIENEADDLFELAIAQLFETCTDPILLIKRKELYVSLETATDQCEDAANVVETIIAKNT
jgi:predicted phosphate transport protein (TIGR00153 family)